MLQKKNASRWSNKLGRGGGREARQSHSYLVVEKMGPNEIPEGERKKTNKQRHVKGGAER